MPIGPTTSKGPTKDGCKLFWTYISQAITNVLWLVSIKLSIFALKHKFHVMIWLYIGPGVIYGVRGVLVLPFFGLRVPYHTVHDNMVKNLLLPAINRGDLRRLKSLNYNKTVFGPRWESSRWSLRPQGCMRRGYFLPILLPSRLGTQDRLVLLLSWYPHFVYQVNAPGAVCMTRA